MKKIGEYTAKGMITSSDDDQHRIQLFDGRFDTGYRIKEFVVQLSFRDTGTAYVASAKLMTEASSGGNRYWNFAKNSEIAWAASSTDANNPNSTAMSTGIVDPDNLIIEDLWLGAVVHSDQEVDVNYMIVMEKYEINEWQGALAMARNRSQA